MKEIYEIVKIIIYFQLFSELLEMLIQDSELKKYIRFFGGILVSIFLITGIFKNISLEKIWEYSEELSVEIKEQDKLEEEFMEKEERKKQELEKAIEQDEKKYQELEENSSQEEERYEKIEIAPITFE